MYGAGCATFAVCCWMTTAGASNRGHRQSVGFRFENLVVVACARVAEDEQAHREAW